jgi:hypothetical protein
MIHDNKIQDCGLPGTFSGGTSFGARSFILDYYIWGPLKRQGQCKLPILPVFEAVIKIEYDRKTCNKTGTPVVTFLTLQKSRKVGLILKTTCVMSAR